MLIRKNNLSSSRLSTLLPLCGDFISSKITNFLNFEEYKDLLNKVDIAIFNNNRQQAGANIKLLIGYGKKVYVSKENSFYKELKFNNIKIFDIENFNLEKINPKIAKKNKKFALKYYSLKSLIKSWQDIFNSK